MFENIFTSIRTTLDSSHEMIFFSKSFPMGTVPILLKNAPDIDLQTKCMISELTKDISLVVFKSENDILEKCFVEGHRYILVGIRKDALKMTMNDYIKYIYDKFYYIIKTVDSFLNAEFEIEEYSFLLTILISKSILNDMFEFEKIDKAIGKTFKITEEKFNKILEEDYSIQKLLDQNYIQLFL